MYCESEFDLSEMTAKERLARSLLLAGRDRDQVSLCLDMHISKVHAIVAACMGGKYYYAATEIRRNLLQGDYSPAMLWRVTGFTGLPFKDVHSIFKGIHDISTNLYWLYIDTKGFDERIISRENLFSCINFVDYIGNNKIAKLYLEGFSQTDIQRRNRKKLHARLLCYGGEEKPFYYPVHILSQKRRLLSTEKVLSCYKANYPFSRIISWDGIKLCESISKDKCDVSPFLALKKFTCPKKAIHSIGYTRPRMDQARYFFEGAGVELPTITSKKRPRLDIY